MAEPRQDSVVEYVATFKQLLQTLIDAVNAKRLRSSDGVMTDEYRDHTLEEVQPILQAALVIALANEPKSSTKP